MTSILVVDNNANTGFRLKKIFEGHQVDFSMATSGTEAINKLHKKFDIIIIDINLGADDGFEVIKRVQEHNFDSIVIIATSTNTRKAFVRGIRMGASDYILKPFEDTYIKGKLLKHINDVDSAVTTRNTSEVEGMIYKHLEKAIKAKSEMLVGIVVLYSVNNPTQKIVKTPIIKGFFSKLDKAVYASELLPDTVKYMGETIDYGMNSKIIVIDGLKQSDKENVAEEVKKMASMMLEDSEFGFEMEFLSLPYELKEGERILDTLSRKIEESIGTIADETM